MVNLTNAAGTVIEDGQATGTIYDNDVVNYTSQPGTEEQAVVRVSDYDRASIEGRLSSEFHVVRSGGTGPLRVYFRMEGTASLDDYSVSASQINPDGTGWIDLYNSEESMPMVLNPFADSQVEGEETATFRLIPDPSNPAAYTIGQFAAAETVILDSQPMLSISDASVTEGGTMQFKVTLSQAPTNSVQVNYATANGSAIAGPEGETGADYLAVSGTVNFAPNEREKWVSVKTHDDTTPEENEAFYVNLSSAVGAGIADAQGEGTILDEDGAPLAPDDPHYVWDSEWDVSDADGSLLASVSGLPGVGALGYTSDDNSHTVVSVDARLQPTNGSATLTGVEARLTLGGIQSETVHYSASGATADGVYRFAVAVDASSLDTGLYDSEMTITQRYSDGSSVQSRHTRETRMVKRLGGEFGEGWTVLGMSRLAGDSRGVKMVRGGNLEFFRNDGSGGYTHDASPSGYKVLGGNWSTGLTVTLRDGTREEYNTAGMLVSRTDRLGNVISYAYTDGDADGVADELWQVTDAAGRTTTLAYAGGLLSQITDFAGRTTTFAYDANRHLTTVTRPDPDGAGPLEAPQIEYGYDLATGLMTSMTNELQKTTSVEYGMGQMVFRMTKSGGGSRGYQSARINAYVDTSSGVGTQSNPAQLTLSSSLATRTDELNHTSQVEVNRHGKVLAGTDALGNTTTLERDSYSRVTRATLPDPDGPGVRVASGTVYLYDFWGNLLQETLPDSTTRKWTYDTTFNQLTSFTDELGRKTLYEIDPANGNVLSMREVVGLVDNATNGETDDVVTAYTYTPAKTLASDPPAGLVSTITDALGRLTRYAYNAHGLVTEVTTAEGTADQSVTRFEYNSADNLTAAIDGLGRRTEYTHDNLDRLIRITEADPDGAGPLTSPVSEFAYDAGNNLLSQTDPLGNVTSFQYNDRGLLSQVTLPDPDGPHDAGTGAGALPNPVVAYEYYADGRMKKEIRKTADAADAAREMLYEYDAAGRVIRMTLPDPDGTGTATSPVYAYSYDNVGNLLTMTDPLGNVASYQYDDRDRLVQVVLPDPDGAYDSATGAGALPSLVVGYQYDAAGQLRKKLLQTADAADGRREMLYDYDTLGRLVTLTEPDPDNYLSSGGADGPLSAPVTQFTYDKAGNLRSESDPLGNLTQWNYDAEDRLVEVILADPDGTGPQTSPVLAYAYDAADQLVSETDALGNLTSYAYDQLGRLLTLALPDPDGAGSATSPLYSFSYDAMGGLLRETDPLGRVTSYQYDRLQRLVKQTAHGSAGAGTGPETVSTYDSLGRMESLRDALGNSTTWAYDLLDRVTSETLPDPDGAGAQTRPVYGYSYDAAGNTLTETDPLGHTTTHQYDKMQRLVKTIEHGSAGPGTGPETVFAFDRLGRQQSLKDPVGNTTTWAYDLLDRVTSETNELGYSRSYVYDAVGNVVQTTDRNGRMTQFDYDRLCRTTAERWMDAGSTVRTLSFAYDANSRMTSASDAAAAYTYTFDNLGRATEIAQDLTGLSLGALEDVVPDVVFAQQFDASGNRTQLAATIGTTADFTNDYAFDHLDRLTRIEQHGSLLGNAVSEKRVDFTYDALSRFDTITRYADLAGTQLAVQTSYTFDDAGRLTDLVHQKGATILADYDYTYDVASRLTQMVSLADGTSTYSYDVLDQVTGAAHTYQTDESYSYDDNGNRMNTGYSTTANNRLQSDGTYDYQYDQEGNRTKKLLTGTTTVVEEYTWDHRNRLVRVTQYDSGTGLVTSTVEYEYDVYNRLVSRNVTSGGSTTTGHFVYDGNQIVLVMDDTAGVENRYLWGPVVDQVLADENAATGDVLWPLADHLGTVRDLASYDSQQNLTTIVNHRVFDSFGNLTSETNGAVDHVFGYTGRYLDPVTGLQWNLNRWYDPAVGRWMSEDPIGFEATDFNLYRYCGNSSLVHVDPTGLIPPGWDSPTPGIALPGYGYPSPTPGGRAFGGSGHPTSGSGVGLANRHGAAWRLVWVLERGGEVRELYVMDAAELDDLEGKVPEEKLSKVRGALKDKYQKITPPEVMHALKAVFGKKKIETREPTGSVNPGKTNPGVNQAGKCMKWGGRVFLVFMVYSEYEKISAADDWTRQLGSSSSGVLGAIGGGALAASAAGAGIGAMGGSPITATVGAVAGGIIGGAVGYELFSGGFEALYDVFYDPE